MKSKLQELIKAYDNYLVLLNDELSDLASMAVVHGWKSKRAGMGVMCRKAIALCKELLVEEEPSVPLSEMHAFAEWTDGSLWLWIEEDNMWWHLHESITTEQLYQLYKQQSK
jgi:hypothetical protein